MTSRQSQTPQITKTPQTSHTAMQHIITYASSLKIDDKTGEWINDYRFRRIADGPILPKQRDFDALCAPLSPEEVKAQYSEHERYCKRKGQILRRHRKYDHVREWFDKTDTLGEV